MTLGKQQRVFSKLVAEFILYIYSKGYEVSLGDAYRDPRVHGAVGVKTSYSSSNSLHKDRLAIDLNLFLNGKYLTSTEDWKELGEYWETLHPLCRWGGRFQDGNHFSMEWQGRK